jgi:hypothetical protein
MQQRCIRAAPLCYTAASEGINFTGSLTPGLATANDPASVHFCHNYFDANP